MDPIPLSAIGLGIAFGVALLSLVASISTWARTARPGATLRARITLIIPVTGAGVDLERLCRSLASQTLAPARLVFVVESAEDPAYRRLAEASAAASLACDIMLTGPANRATQKCHNLSLALAAADDGTSIVVLADADIVPQPGWLADLVRPIAGGRAECVSGYRWALPTDTRAGTLLAAWIDRAIASMPKFRWQTMAWAGSFAFAPGVLGRLDAVRLLSTAVSDDMSLARAASDCGSPVLYRLRVLVPSPVSHTLDSFLGFATRQYQMLRLHQPRVWYSALATVSILFAVRAGLWTAAFLSLFWLKVLGAFLLLNWVAYWVRLRRARYLDCWPIRERRAEALLWLMPLFGPVIDLAHLLAILRGFRLGTIRWSHLTYRLEEGKVASIERRNWS